MIANDIKILLVTIWAISATFILTGQVKSEFDTLYNQALAIYQQSPDSSLSILEDAETLAIDGNLHSDLGKAYWFIAYIHDITDDNHNATTYYLAASRIFKQLGDFESMQSMLQNSGTIARRVGDLKTAKSLFQNRIDCCFEKVAKYRVKADMYYDLGLIAQSMGELSESTELFLKSRRILEKNPSIEDTVFYSDNSLELGLNHLLLAQKEKHQYLLDTAKSFLLMAMEEDRSPFKKAKIQVNLSELFFMEMDLDTSEQLLLEAKDYQEAYGSKNLLVSLYNSLGRLYYLKEEYKESLHYLRLSLSKNLEVLNPIDRERDVSNNVAQYYIDQVEQSVRYVDSVSIKTEGRLLAYQDTELLMRTVQTIVTTRSEYGLNDQAMVSKAVFDHYSEDIADEDRKKQLRNWFILFIVSLVAAISVIRLISYTRRRIVFKKALSETTERLAKKGIKV